MALKTKSRILDKIEKRLTKMSWGIDKQYLGEGLTLENWPSAVNELTIETA